MLPLRPTVTLSSFTRRAALLSIRQPHAMQPASSSYVRVIRGYSDLKGGPEADNPENSLKQEPDHLGSSSSSEREVHKKGKLEEENMTEQQAEVEEHNKEFEQRHDRAPKAEADKVDKKFWSGTSN